MNIIGTNLKDLRIKKKITLEQLAVQINEKFSINITRSMISKWETGKSTPIYDHLKRLAFYYDVTTDFLLGFDKTDYLNIINYNKNLNAKNQRIRFSKKTYNSEAIIKLLEDDKITNKDLLYIQDFIHLIVSRKDKNTYR